MMRIEAAEGPADLRAGGAGVGKSHVSQALAHEACRRGYEVLSLDTAKMLAHLAGGRHAMTVAGWRITKLHRQLLHTRERHTQNARSHRGSFGRRPDR